MKKHERALVDFLQGQTLKQIAVKYDVKYKTVDGWHSRRNWAEKRLECTKIYEETLYKEISDDAVNIVKRLVKHTLMAADAIARAGKEILEERDITAQQQLIKFMLSIRANIMLSKAFRNILPDSDERLTEELLAELKRVGVK